MQNFLNRCFIVVLVSIVCAPHCSSGQVNSLASDNLVRVAIVKLVNVSKQPAYEYLSDSLTEAGRASMRQKFSYTEIPSEGTTRIFADLEARAGVADAGSLRSHALAIDADILIYGHYNVSPGKKGDGVEIIFRIFRADQSAAIGELSRKTTISGKVFREIDALAGEVAAAIGAYRSRQMKEQGKAATEASGEKISLTRDSLNILPFIPPVF